MAAISHNGPGVMTLEQFAAQSGASEGTVRGWMDRGYVPTVRIGARRLVNVVAWYEQLAEEAEGDAA